MKASSFALVLLLICSLCLRGEDRTTQVTRAAGLNAEGKFRAALDLIAPLVESAQGEPAPPVLGIAWNVRGLALQSLGESAAARRSYETAIRILREAPGFEKQYAAALDNLGSLEAEAGHYAESRALRLRAEKICASAGDQAGVARILNNLALIAIGERNWREARRDLAEGFEAQRKLAKPDKDDAAAFSVAQCLEQEHEGDYRSALAAVGRAIDLWTERHGPKYYLLATGYSMRAGVEEALHDNQAAIGDFEHSLRLMEDDQLKETRAYALTEMVYARALRNAGKPEEAAEADATAHAMLSGVARQPCRNCTISAESLR